jgi:hypothetical protein
MKFSHQSKLLAVLPGSVWMAELLPVPVVAVASVGENSSNWGKWKTHKLRD